MKKKQRATFEITLGGGGGEAKNENVKLHSDNSARTVP